MSKALHGVEPYRGAVFLFSKSHGAVRYDFCFLGIVRCGAVRFSHFRNHRVRCSAVFLLKRRGTVRYDFYFSRIVRCDAARLSVEQLFPTVRLSVQRS